jgi:hypothetical protein
MKSTTGLGNSWYPGRNSRPTLPRNKSEAIPPDLRKARRNVKQNEKVQ